jgi:stress responsive alpha/beta barrel protein
VIRHIALFKLKSGLTWDNARVRAAEKLQEQVGNEIAELRSWHCGRNISARDIAYDYAIVGLVDDADALARYLAHPFHQKVAKSWSLISDRVIADVLEESR